MFLAHVDAGSYLRTFLFVNGGKEYVNECSCSFDDRDRGRRGDQFALVRKPRFKG